MKRVVRFIGIFLIICLSMTMSACKKQTDQKKESEEAKQTFDIKVATNILQTYMGYIIKDDMESAKKMYSDDLMKKQKDTPKTNLKIFGYKTDEINEVGRSALFKVRVSKATTDKPTATLDMYSIKIENKDGNYKITEIDTTTEKDAFFEETGIRVREKNNVKTNLLVDMSGIPQFAYPKNDKAKLNKIEVPKNKFGIVSFAYSGEKMAFTTESSDTYIAVVKSDPAQATQGGSGGGGAGGGAGAGAGAGGASGQGMSGGSNQKVRETPIGKDLTSIDILKDSKVELVTFSQEEKFLLVQYNKINMGKSIRLYDADSGELAPISFEDYFPQGKVDVKFSSFDKDALNIDVSENAATDKNQAQLIGRWQVDLKEFKLKKL